MGEEGRGIGCERRAPSASMFVYLHSTLEADACMSMILRLSGNGSVTSKAGTAPFTCVYPVFSTSTACADPESLSSTQRLATNTRRALNARSLCTLARTASPLQRPQGWKWISTPH